MAAIHAAWVESLFVGAAMVATSVGITAQVLAAKGLQQRASKVILAAAVIDDILGLLVLAFVSSVARGHVNVPSLVMTFAMAAAFTVLIAKYGSAALSRVMPRVEQKLTAAESQFNLALLFLVYPFGSGCMARCCRNRRRFSRGHGSVGNRHHPCARPGPGYQRTACAILPARSVCTGKFPAFAGAATIWLSIGILVAAILTKLIGCGLGAWRLGGADMLRIGVGMIPRGEVGMVVAQIGLGMGVITESVYAVVVFMTVATTLVAPPMLKFAYRKSPRGLPEEKFTLS